MPLLFNRAGMTTTTTGTGTVTLVSATTGNQTFASAGVANNDVVRYVIEDGSAWEIGSGTFATAGTLTRPSGNVVDSTNAGGLITLTGSAEVFVDAAAEDVLTPDDIGVTVQGYDVDTLKADTHDTLTAGFDSTEEGISSTILSSPITLEVDGDTKENFKTVTADTAWTLNAPSTSSSCVIVLRVTNATGAGTLTTSGFDLINGDTYATTVGADYFFYITKCGGFTTLTIEEINAS